MRTRLVSVDAHDPPSPLAPYPPSSDVEPPEVLPEPELDAPEAPELDDTPELDGFAPPAPEEPEDPPPPASPFEPLSLESEPLSEGVLVPQPRGPSLHAKVSRAVSARRAEQRTVRDSIEGIAGRVTARSARQSCFARAGRDWRRAYDFPSMAFLRPVGKRGLWRPPSVAITLARRGEAVAVLAPRRHWQGFSFSDIVLVHPGEIMLLPGMALKNLHAALSPSSFQRNQGIETCSSGVFGTGMCVAPVADHQ
jgi:hypothetical protein